MKTKEEKATYMREYYRKNYERIKIYGIGQSEKTKRSYRKKREWLDSIKSQPCMDCGVNYPPVVMDFDHVRGKKLFNITKGVTSHKAIKVIEEEIAKCEIVCANCHRIRTTKRRTLGDLS